jgi:hypothetical protein
LEKKVVELPSFVAITEIVTPAAGIVDAMVTLRLKGARAGARTVPFAGVMVTAREGSGVLFPPPPPQPHNIGTSAMTSMANMPLEANRCFISELY